MLALCNRLIGRRSWQRLSLLAPHCHRLAPQSCSLLLRVHFSDDKDCITLEKGVPKKKDPGKTDGKSSQGQDCITLAKGVPKPCGPGKSGDSPSQDRTCITLSKGVVKPKECKGPAKPDTPADKPTGTPICKPMINQSTGQISLKIIPAGQPFCRSYDERNMAKGRELSPHLSIYKKQLTSVMSILLRMSGFVMAFGIWGIGLVGLFGGRDINDWAIMVEGLKFSQEALTILKFFIILPFTYHVVAATRHLIWHLDMFLTKPQIYGTGYVAIVLSIALAVALALIKVEPYEGDRQKQRVDLTSGEWVKQ